MKKIKSLVGLFGGFAALTSNASDDMNASSNESNAFQFLQDVETAPLNIGELPTYLASHRSHSSHASHSSHRSSSGGTYRAAPVPKSTPTPKAPSEPLAQPSRPASTIPSPEESKLAVIMSDKDKRKNIILRVQLTLQALDAYHGSLDGVMGPETRQALSIYRALIGLPKNEKLDVEVLNALGILF